MKINNVRDDLTDNVTRKEALMAARKRKMEGVY